MPRRHFRIGLVLALAVGTFAVFAPSAQAAVTLTVNSTGDVATNFGDCGSNSTTVPPSLSLREATCIANNYGNSQAVTIDVSAGTYTLTNGELQLNKVSGSNVTITGAGSASTVIDGDHLSRVLDLDPNVVGGVTTSISGVTITNGRDSTFGGAGIIAGSGTKTSLDTLTVTDSVLSNNQASFNVKTQSNKPGGGISMQGGKLTLTNDTLSNNESYSSGGSGVWYQAAGSAAGQTLTVSGSTFSGNSAPNSGASGTVGGALAVSGGAGGTYTVTNSTFTGNTASSATSEAAAGAAIWDEAGSLTVTGSTFTNNSVSNSVSAVGGGAVLWDAGSATLQYDRMVGNTTTGTGADVMTNSGSGSVTATEDWWGCNAGPNTSGCDSTTGTNLTAAPRLTLSATASPAHVIGPNGTSTLTASLLTDSNGGAVSGSNLTGAFDGVPVTFADPPGDATVTLASGAHSVNLASGTASIDYHSNTTVGPDNDAVTLDNGSATDVLEVDEAPTINSADTANFTTGTAGTFTVTTTGYPNAEINETGSLPSGLTFQDNGDGSATISWTPDAGTGGNYPLNLTASNGYSPDATQTLTVTVSQAPAFTSGSSATFVIGQAGSFDVTTSGFPTVSTISESGALPDGITYTDNGDGTAKLSGTPTGTGNTYPITLTAQNGVSPDGTQDLTIQVNQAPQVTQDPVDQTVAPGDPVTFTAAASGVPTPTVQWQVSTAGGGTFSDIGGATSTSYTFNAAAGDNGNQYRAVFSNGVGSPATSAAATLTVGTAPSFTSADHTTFAVGTPGSFPIATNGSPNASLSETGTQFPSWLTLTDNGDGTGTLTGTPPAGFGGTYDFTLGAANGISPDASQPFTLTVDEPAGITSANSTAFTAGSAGTFTVTTSGYPHPSLGSTGSLPSGVTFADNGDGTATLAGTTATGGTFPLTITASNTSGPDATQNFVLSVLPAVTSVSPSSGSTAGGTTITVDGSGFTDTSRVLIGQGGSGPVRASVVTQTPTEITAVTPAGKRGTWNVFVWTPGAGISAASHADLFSYQLSQPVVTAVSPSSGPSTGGTTITIDGSGFTDRSRVLIGQGGSGAVSASVVTQTPTELTAMTPAGKPGRWNVFVQTPGAGFSAATPADLFMYQLPSPVVTSVSPPSGPSTGGTTITIDGSGFTDRSRVLIGQGGTGAVIASVVTQTPTELTAVTPAGKPGRWNVFVQTPGAGFSDAVPADRFTYESPTSAMSRHAQEVARRLQ
jgi:hypothetical protein